MPIIGHTDQALAAILDRNLNSARPGIQRVFNEFLDRRGRTLHHFARRNPVNGRLIELPNFRQIWAYLGVGRVHAPRDSMRARDSKQLKRTCGLFGSVGRLDPIRLTNDHEIQIIRAQDPCSDSLDVLIRHRIHIVIARRDVGDRKALKLHPR